MVMRVKSPKTCRCTCPRSSLYSLQCLLIEFEMVNRFETGDEDQRNPEARAHSISNTIIFDVGQNFL